MIIDGSYSHMQEEDWRKRLSAEEYKVLREAGTEAPFTGKFCHTIEEGTYCCAGCNSPLFSSDVKFDSGTGWPSFFEPIEKKAITFHIDFHLPYPRKEVRCSKCQSHLGHVYDDGPSPTFKRYSINSVSLLLYPKLKF